MDNCDIHDVSRLRLVYMDRSFYRKRTSRTKKAGNCEYFNRVIAGELTMTVFLANERMGKCPRGAFETRLLEPV